MFGSKVLILVLGIVSHEATVTKAFSSSNTFLPKSYTSTTTKLNQSAFDGDVSFENAVRNGWTPSRGQFVGLRRMPSSTQREMSDSDGAIMPDGGLSPCIIKVVGVGGGGCNAVSVF